MAPLSEEEENYVRLALLLKGVTPRAVRTYFDREFPPTSLSSTLSTSKNTLWDLKLNRVINQAQWNLLYPRNGVVDSKTFDVTLMICLIRNLTSINPPINGFDALPPPGETTPSSDLARIKCYRNKLAHHDNNTIDRTYFNAAWRDISNAVRRLGGETMYLECQDLKVKILDQSNREIILEIQQSMKETKELRHTVDNLGMELSRVTENLRELQTSNNILQTSYNTLQTQHSKIMESLKDPVPWNIKELITKQIADWEMKDKMFVSTNASDYVMDCLQDNSCLTLTAPSGVGKSFIARHSALLLKKEGYDIIPVDLPLDIKTYYQPGKKTVFIVDDICGNFTANQIQIDKWKQLLPVIDIIIADKCCKIIVSCRLQVYKDEKFNILSPFKSCECNLISDKLSLTSVEKTKIASTYFGTSMEDLHKISQKYDFFPLLCSLYHDNKNVDAKEFFKKPFDVYKNELDKLSERVYKNELDKLSEHGDEHDEGKYRICSLALCVISNNHLEEKWFQGKLTERQKQIIQDIYDVFKFDRGISKAKLQHSLDTLDGTFICKQNGIYRTVHDKLFDFLAHYLGQKMIKCLIDYGASNLIHERFIWQKSSPNDKNSYIDFIIEIPDEFSKPYLKRCINDWSVGYVTVVLGNNNLKVSSFEQQLLQYLQQIHRSKRVTLANTKDTVIPKDNYGSGNTPLIVICYYGYTDMVQWILHHDVDVNQCRDDGVTGLYMASQEGHTDVVKLLLEKDPNVDLCNNDGCSPLYTASQKGHTDIVKLLLEKNPNVDLCNKNGCSPLYMTSQNGHTDIVKLLLEKDPNVDICNKDGCSPLYIASQNGHTAIVKLLLEKDPNVDVCNKDGCSPLYTASQKGHTDIVKLLLEKNPNVDICNKYGCSPLYMTSQNGHTDIVKLLLEKDPIVDICNKDGCSPLNIASQNGYTTIVKLLLEKDPNVDICNKNGCSPLYIASQNGHTAIVKLLLEKDPNVNVCNKDGCSPLYIASQNGHTAIVKLLLEKDPNVDICNKYGCSPLNIASQKGHTDIVKLLLEKNPNVDLCNNDGCSPMHMTCQNGHTDIVKLLLEKDPNANICNKDGCSPLYIASHKGHTDIVKLLLEKYPNVDVCDKDGCSPLNIASHNGHTDIIKLLLEKDPNVDLCNKDGCSPLFRASNNGHTDIVKLLLEKDSHVDICDNGGCSPLYIASQNGYTDIVMLLLEKDPNVDICNNDGNSSLNRASHNGHTAIVKLLLEKNPNVDVCCRDGFTPLINSCESNHTNIVQLLLKHKPNIDAQTYEGCNALMFSAVNGNLEITQLLVKNHADCNMCCCSKQSLIDTIKSHSSKTLEKEKQGSFDYLIKKASSHVADYISKKTVNYVFEIEAGCTPLHFACFMNRLDVVRCLLDHNANINMTNEDVTTPLFFACEVGNEDIVRLLLDKGADTQICRLDRKSPLQIATDNGHTSIVMIVSEHMMVDTLSSDSCSVVSGSL